MKKEAKDLENSRILRLNAEEQLKEIQKKGKAQIGDFDSKKLLHELQVHQIELEMQNEELKDANAIAEKALRKYTMLYDFSPMGYFTLDSHGTISDLNFTAADLLNEKRFSLIDTNFSLFVNNESKSVFDDFLKKVYSSNRKESCKLMLGFDNKPLSYVYLEGIVTGENHNCLIAAFDISGFTKQ
jgi:PAS domain-containing protein